MKKTGRPCKYSTKLMERICELIAEGKSERQIGRMKGLPSPATMRRWKLTHPEFGRRSAIAREESAALYRELALEKAMECSEIADKIIKGTFVNASGQHVSEVPRGVAELAKLYIQEMNREAALRDDRRFGDRQRVALSGDRDAAPVQVQAIAPMTPEELKAIQDLEIAERENRFARGEL